MLNRRLYWENVNTNLRRNILQLYKISVLAVENSTGGLIIHYLSFCTTEFLGFLLLFLSRLTCYGMMLLG